MLGGIQAISARVREIEARLAGLGPQGRLPVSGSQGSQDSVNIRSRRAISPALPSPDFGRMLQTELMRLSTAGLTQPGGQGEPALYGRPGSWLSELAPGFLTQLGQNPLLSYGAVAPFQNPLTSQSGGLNTSFLPQLGAGALGLVPLTYKYNPFRDLQVTSPFGPREWNGRLSQHDGTDYAVAEGTPLPAIGAGTVIAVAENAVFGRHLIYQLDSGEKIRYAHLTDRAPFMVIEGQRVLPGEVIGLSGNTGVSTGPHLHLSVEVGGKYVDPQLFLQGLP